MTHDQKILVRYWLFLVAVLCALALLFEHEYFRWIVAIALFPLAAIDRAIRPSRPDDVPSALEIIENSLAWKTFFVGYAIAAVAIAPFSITNKEVAIWLTSSTWLLLPAILLLIAGPIVQSEIAQFKVCGNGSE
jgi:hypothetical protein